MTTSTTDLCALETPLKIGVLARRTGLSVRTLHHYDEIGLLVASERTPSGHRLYANRDVQRLQQIRSLRAMGLALDEIRHLLNGGAFSARRVIELHLERLRLQVVQTQRLVERLKTVARHLQTAKRVPIEDLCRIIEGTIMMEHSLSPEQLSEIKAHAEQLGSDRIHEVEREWAEVIPAVRAHMAKETGPDDPDLQALARRWRGLVDTFTGGNREIAAGVRKMYEQSHEAINAANPNTPDPDMFAYMRAVFARIGGGPG